MSVDLRCPTCGTTQGHAGECEACFEGEVRYFCTNHDDGLWLEGPVCSRCGVKFGDAPRKPPPAPAPRVPTPPAGAPDFRSPGGHRTSARAPEPDLGRRPTTRIEREKPPEPEGLPPTLLETLLEAISADHARSGAGGRYESEPPRAAPRARRRGFPLGGCLLRIVGLVFLLIVAAVIFLLMVFGGLVIG